MKKKVYLLGIILLMSLSLLAAGCGNSSGSKESPSGSKGKSGDHSSMNHGSSGNMNTNK